MKLSLKLEYACQVLAQLGKHYEAKELPHIETLSKAEAIPSNYLVQILNDLRNAGLIISRRGKQGGYALAKKPNEISLADIIIAVDGELLAFTENGKGESAQLITEAWMKVERKLSDVTHDITVESMMPNNTENMWYI